MNNNTRKGGEYGSASISEEVLAASTVTVSYVPVGAVQSSSTAAASAPRVTIALNPGGVDPAVPGSVLFSWMGQDYSDHDGVIYRGRTATHAGVQCGTMHYDTCMATLDAWVPGPNPQTVILRRLWTRKPLWSTGVIYGRTATAPIRPGGLTLTATDLAGGSITAQVNAQGVITGEEAWGAMDFATGAYQVMFGKFVSDGELSTPQKAEWWYDPSDLGTVEPGKIWRPRPVDPASLRYNAVAYTYLPIDGQLMGLTPERLPPDGRMPFARAGDYCVISRTITGSAFVPVAGNSYDVGAQRLSSVDVLGANGEGLVSTGYSVDLDAGTLQIDDTSGWPAQVIVRGRIEVYRRIAEVRIDGTVRLTTPIGHQFARGDVFSTALRFGNKFAHVLRVFDQHQWAGVTWADARDGAEALGNYDVNGYPVEVNNRGAITERWALRFRADGQTFDLIGKHMGLIASGVINADFSPVNPASGTPYFTLRAAGWGGGWVAGNVLFIHTVGAEMPFAFIRSVSPGDPTATEYRALLAVRGSGDQPPSNPFQD